MLESKGSQVTVFKKTSNCSDLFLDLCRIIVYEMCSKYTRNKNKSSKDYPFKLKENKQDKDFITFGIEANTN